MGKRVYYNQVVDPWKKGKHPLPWAPWHEGGHSWTTSVSLYIARLENFKSKMRFPEMSFSTFFTHGCTINMEMREFNHVWLFAGKKANMLIC